MSTEASQTPAIENAAPAQVDKYAGIEVSTDDTDRILKSADPDAQEPTKAEQSKDSSDAPAADDASESTTDSQRQSKTRYKKLVKEREEANRRAERLELELKSKASDQKAQDAPGEEPQLGDFDTYDDYDESYRNWQAQKQKAKDAPAEKDKTASDEKASDQAAFFSKLTDSQKTALGVVQAVIEDSSDVPDDFAAVIEEKGNVVTPDILEAVAECDDPAKVVYHLCKNEALAAQLAKQSPIQQAKTLTKLEAQLQKPATVQRKTTKAPDPITPVRSDVNFKDKSPQDMSIAEYEQWRAKGQSKSNGW